MTNNINTKLLGQIPVMLPTLSPKIDGSGDKAAAICNAAGDCYVAPGGDESKVEEKTKESIQVLAGLIGGNEAEVTEALARLQGIASDIPLEKVSLFTLIAMILIDLLRDQPERAETVKERIIQMIVDGDYPLDVKTEIMDRLTTLHNHSTSTEVQKSAIVAVFEAARVAGEGLSSLDEATQKKLQAHFENPSRVANPLDKDTQKRIDAFRAGLVNVPNLKDKDHVETAAYLLTFAQNAHDITAIAVDKKIQAEYVKALKVYTDLETKNMYPVIGTIAKLWFDNKTDKEVPILWESLMYVSKQGGECDVPDTDGKKVKLDVAVRDAFYNYYLNRDQDIPVEPAKIAFWVTAHLDYKFIPELFGKVPDLQVGFIDNFISSDPYKASDGSEPVKTAVLAGLASYDNEQISDLSEKERAMLRTYFHFIDVGWKAQAVSQGVQVFDMHHRLVNYLVDQELKWDNTGSYMRDSAHKLLTDGSVRDDGAFVVKYGLMLLEEEGEVSGGDGLVEETCRQAPNPAIKGQCGKTIDILYEAHRIHNSLYNVSVGMRAQPHNSLTGTEKIERDPGAFSVSLDYMSPEGESEWWRLLLGLDYSRFLEMQSLEFRVGAGRDLSERLFAKANLSLGWLNLWGTDDDRSSIPMNLSLNEDGSYSGRVKSPDMNLNAGSIGLDVSLSWALFRNRLGKGDTFAGQFVLYFGAVIFGGVANDEGCSYAFDPKDALFDIKDSGNGDYTYCTKAPLSQACRDNEFILGYYLRAMAGFQVEF